MPESIGDMWVWPLADDDSGTAAAIAGLSLGIGSGLVIARGTRERPSEADT